MAGPVSLGNTTDSLLLPLWLQRNYLTTFDRYDDNWEPWLLKMMPKTVAPGNGSKQYWTRDYSADPQGMARYYETDEAIEPMASPDLRPWNYRTRMLGNAFRRGKDAFEEDFMENALSRAHGQMMKNLTRFINRSIEWTLNQFAYGEEDMIAYFTDQSTDRLGYANINAGTWRGDDVTGDGYLGGTRWDDFSGDHPDVFDELSYLKERYKYMAQKKPEYFMIGRSTEYALERNDNLIDRLIYIEDTTQGVLGTHLADLELIRVVGNTYKESTAMNAGALGMPGAGDYLRHTWERANVVEMMTRDDLSGQTWEWGLLGARNIGEVACGWVDTDHRDQRGKPTEMFIEQFQTRRPKQVWTTAKLNICPVVYKFSNFIPVQNIVHSIE